MLSNAWHWGTKQFGTRQNTAKLQKDAKSKRTCNSKCNSDSPQGSMEREKSQNSAVHCDIWPIEHRTMCLTRFGTSFFNEKCIKTALFFELAQHMSWRLPCWHLWRSASLQQWKIAAGGPIGRDSLDYWPVGSQAPEFVELLHLMIFHAFSCCRKRMPTTKSIFRFVTSD